MSRHVDLMRLHDGELSAEEVLELERSLTAEDRAILAGLEQLNGVVRELDDGRVARFDVADAVMAALDEDAGAAKVVPLRPRVEADPVVPVSRRRRPRTGPVVIAGLALAAAAAAALWIGTPAGGPSSPPPVASPVQPAPSPEVPAAPEPAVEVAEEDRDPAATIEAVDFGNQGGSIFMVPAGEESTPVVWLVDEPASARVEPL